MPSRAYKVGTERNQQADSLIQHSGPMRGTATVGKEKSTQDLESQPATEILAFSNAPPPYETPVSRISGKNGRLHARSQRQAAQHAEQQHSAKKLAEAKRQHKAKQAEQRSMVAAILHKMLSPRAGPNHIAQSLQVSPGDQFNGGPRSRQEHQPEHAFVPSNQIEYIPIWCLRSKDVQSVFDHEQGLDRTPGLMQRLMYTVKLAKELPLLEHGYIHSVLKLEADLMHHRVWKFLVHNERNRNAKHRWLMLDTDECSHRRSERYKIDLHTPSMYSQKYPPEFIMDKDGAYAAEKILAILHQKLENWEKRLGVTVVTGAGSGTVFHAVEQRLLFLTNSFVESFTPGDKNNGSIVVFLRPTLTGT